MTRTFLPNSNGIGQQPTAEKVASYGLKVVTRTATCDACDGEVLGMGGLYAYED